MREKGEKEQQRKETKSLKCGVFFMFKNDVQIFISAHAQGKY